jgi:nucleoside-diphosphate-sugar epimerase
VKRVVVTSSCGAIYDISDQPRVFTEADWNQQACKEVEERGRDAGVMHKYRASKTLAEQGMAAGD